MPDRITIERMQLSVHIGVPDEERARSQRVDATITVYPDVHFDALGDDIGNTVDYDRLAGEIRELAAAKPRRLLETLAADIARHVLEHHAVRETRVQLHKFVLPDTDSVSVAITRSRATN